MPLYIDGHEFPLLNEISPEDFDRPGFGKWLRASFESGLYVPGTPSSNQTKERLANFLNNDTVGPYFVMEGIHNTREPLHLFLLDPRDRETFKTEFRKDFDARLWREKPEAAAKNAELLARQAKEEFSYENRNMQNLLAVIRAQESQGNGGPQHIDAMMRFVWNGPGEPHAVPPSAPAPAPGNG